MILSGATDIGLCRKENQDTFKVGRISNSLCWAVMCDGMGGACAGKQASEHAVSAVGKRLRTWARFCTKPEAIEKLLFGAVKAGNKDVLRLSRRGKDVRTMGTTVVAVIVRDNVAYIAHAGDSRAYLVRKKDILQITKDHSMVQELVDSGRITKDEAYNHPNKNIVTSALGVEEYPTVDFDVVEMAAGEVLILCSDGLTNMVKDDAIKKTVRTCADAEKLPAALIKKALAGGGNDNVTVVVLKAE